MASWNALNDYLDYEIDKFNRPEKPLPSGSISLKNAKSGIILMMGASLLSMVIAAYVASTTTNGIIQWWPSIIIWVLAVLLLINYESSSKYSLNLKNRGLPGNVAISASVAMVVLLGAAGVFQLTNIRVISVAIIGFLYNLSREIVKDVQDMEGDKGRNTLAMKIGPEKTRVIAYMISLVTLISIIMPFALDIFDSMYLIINIPAIFLLLKVKTKLALGHDFHAQQLLKKISILRYVWIFNHITDLIQFVKSCATRFHYTYTSTRTFVPTFYSLPGQILRCFLNQLLYL